MEDAKAKARAAALSVAASAGLTVLKLAAGALSGSLALISEGAHNALDVAASGLTYFAVRIADRPADESHPFGHGKVEAVAALVETGLLIALAGGVAALAILRFGEPSAVVPGPFAFAVLGVSIVVDTLRWRALSRIARATGSDALAADALHYVGDLFASAMVLAGLAATAAGLAHADAYAAVAVAVFIAGSGLRLGKRTVDALIDAAPEGLADDVRGALAQVDGVVGVDYLRLRRSGAGAVGELGLAVSRTEPLERVAAIKERATAALARRWPRMTLTIAANPRALDDETVLDRVLLTAARRRLFVHHVAIQRIGDKVAVSLDLEVAGDMTLGRAHEVASRLEQAIEAEFDGAVEVDTHIEPMETRELQGCDADAGLTEKVAQCLAVAAGGSRLLREVHHVRLRAAGAGFYGLFHCYADADATLEAVHAEVDALERAARAEFPEISRIIGHAEPRP